MQKMTNQHTTQRCRMLNEFLLEPHQDDLKISSKPYPCDTILLPMLCHCFRCLLLLLDIIISNHKCVNQSLLYQQTQFHQLFLSNNWLKIFINLAKSWRRKAPQKRSHIRCIWVDILKLRGFFTSWVFRLCGSLKYEIPLKLAANGLNRGNFHDQKTILIDEIVLLFVGSNWALFSRLRATAKKKSNVIHSTKIKICQKTHKVEIVSCIIEICICVWKTCSDLFGVTVAHLETTNVFGLPNESSSCQLFGSIIYIGNTLIQIKNISRIYSIILSH